MHYPARRSTSTLESYAESDKRKLQQFFLFSHCNVACCFIVVVAVEQSTLGKTTKKKKKTIVIIVDFYLVVLFVKGLVIKLLVDIAVVVAANVDVAAMPLGRLDYKEQRTHFNSHIHKCMCAEM